MDPLRLHGAEEDFLDGGLDVTTGFGVETLVRDHSIEPNQVPGTSFGVAPHLVFDACGILFSAIESRSSLDGLTIQQGLANFENYQGATGSMSFQGHGDPQKSIFIFEIQGGRVTFSKRILP